MNRAERRQSKITDSRVEMSQGRMYEFTERTTPNRRPAMDSTTFPMDALVARLRDTNRRLMVECSDVEFFPEFVRVSDYFFTLLKKYPVQMNVKDFLLTWGDALLECSSGVDDNGKPVQAPKISHAKALFLDHFFKQTYCKYLPPVIRDRIPGALADILDEDIEMEPALKGYTNTHGPLGYGPSKNLS